MVSPAAVGGADRGAAGSVSGWVVRSALLYVAGTGLASDLHVDAALWASGETYGDLLVFIYCGHSEAYPSRAVVRAVVFDGYYITHVCT